MSIQKRVEASNELRGGACKCGAPVITHGRSGRPKSQCWDCENAARNARKRSRRAEIKTKEAAG